MSDWEHRSSSYRRGYVAGQERDVYFAKLVEGAADQEEAMQGYADGLAAAHESDERQRFQAWLVASGKDSRFLGRDHNGVYWSGDNESKWQAWQAALTFGSKHGNTSDQVQQG